VSVQSPPPPSAVPARRCLLREHQLDDVTLVEVVGDVDIVAAPDLRAALGRAIHRRATLVAVDLIRVTAIDDFGLSSLLNAARRLRRQGGTLRVTCPEGRARRAIERARLGPTLGLTDGPV
jgi:anti-sigma B factor antagonist